MSEAGGRITVAERDAVAEIVIDHPARRNAMSLAMWQALGRAIGDVSAAAHVRVILLRGAGDLAFVSGADVSEFDRLRDDPATTALYDQAAAAAQAAIETTPLPVVAAIRGYCLGAGVGLAAAADIRIASASSRFGIPAARLGLGYGAGGVRRLMRLIGPARTRELLFSARRIDAAEALRIGLVEMILPDAEFADGLAAYAATLAANAPLTIRAAKIAVRELQRPPGEQDLNAVDAAVRACFASADYAEGRRAFAAKRAPRFEGR